MSVETGLVRILTTNSGVSALVATRIYPVLAVEGTPFPCLVYQRISTARDANSMDNAAELPRARFQFSCLASNFTDAVALEVAVRTALAGFTGLADDTTIQAALVVDTRDTFEYDLSTTGAYRRDLDFEIYYQE
ncbi:MAG TPA: DUF3168 domain-containing protein [Terriglobia bacterium]|nr:DUF3168 domain-containing protein [Terriglobia bacterium]